MKNKLPLVVSVARVLLFLCLSACVKNRNFDTPESGCTNLAANVTFKGVKDLYIDETFQIQEDLIIEGYVISSDGSGNFFNELYIQDAPESPTSGFQLEIEMRDSHLFYPVGSKVLIKLKGLYLGKSKGVFKLGATFSSFGNVSVGRLPATVVGQHVLSTCGPTFSIKPTLVSLGSLEGHPANTLVRIADVEISETQLGETFAIEREETERILIDCDDNEIGLVNSGYSDFQADQLPIRRGSITALLSRENDRYFLRIRELGDIAFDNERCVEVVDEFSSSQIFISELADPDNNSGARFVELYNAASEPLSLKGWVLRRYTNANTEVGSIFDLSGHSIAANGTLVIASNAGEFEATYGFAADVTAGTNSPADSNGDDNLELVDPFGAVIDRFGVIGEDGSGTNHEFEDGRALRRPEIIGGNATYDFNEWIIYNDSGGSGTMKDPQIAPQDYSPGERN